MRPISGLQQAGSQSEDQPCFPLASRLSPSAPSPLKMIHVFSDRQNAMAKKCVSLCCVALCGFFLFPFFFLSGLPQQSGSRLCGSEKKEKNSLLRLIQGEIMGPIPPQQPNPVQGGQWGGRGHPPPTRTHAQIPSPPPNKVHRVQPGRRRHIKERFSGSIGSDYFQSVCCFRCVDSTNQTMVRIRSRVQPPPTDSTDCRQLVETESHFHVSVQKSPN